MNRHRPTESNVENLAVGALIPHAASTMRRIFVLVVLAGLGSTGAHAQEQPDGPDPAVQSLLKMENIDGLGEDRLRELFREFQFHILDLSRTGAYEQGLSLAEKERNLFPDEAKSYVDTGTFLLWTGKVDEALREFEISLEKPTHYYSHPADAVRCLALNNAAAIDIERRKFKKARKRLEESQSLDSKSGQTHFLIGTVDLETEKLEEAIKQFKRAVELDPRSGTPIDYIRYATSLRKKKKHPEASEVLGKAIGLYPLEPALHYYLGASYVDQDRYLDAFFQFHIEFYLYRTNSPFYQENLEFLTLVTERARASKAENGVDPKYPYLYRLVRAQELVAEDPGRALTYYREVAEEKGAHPMLHVFIGEAHFAAGQTAEALEAFLAAVKMNRHLVPAYIDLARAFKAQGLELKAESAIERALFLDPDNWKVKSILEKADQPDPAPTSG